MPNTTANTTTHADVNRKFMAQMEGQLAELKLQYEGQLDAIVQEATRQKANSQNRSKWNHYSETDALNLQSRVANMASVAANIDRQQRAIETMKDLLAWLPPGE